MVSSKDHSSCTVQYVLKFVNELLVAANLETMRLTGALRLSARLNTAQRTVAASGKLVDASVEQHTKITNAGRRLYGSGGW